MRNRGRLLLAFLLLGLVSTRVAAAQKVAIRSARIYTVTQGIIENGTIVLADDKIEAVGKDIAIPPDAKVIDATGRVVIPGLIDAFDRVGLEEIEGESITIDSTEYTDPVHPALRVIDSLNPQSEVIRVTRAEGITNALAVPREGNVLAGQGALIHLDGSTVDEMTVRAPVAMHVSFGEAARREYGPRNKAPQTRMGVAAVLRTALIKGQNYATRWDDYRKKFADWEAKKEGKPPSPPDRDLDLDALQPVLRGELPVIASARRLDDILTALRIAEEFHLRLVLAHATDAYRIAPMLAEKKIPVLVGPIREEPQRIEELGTRLDNAAILAKAGVKIAIGTDEVHDARDLPLDVGFAMGYGLDPDQALRAVTSNPAEIFGVADRLGSITPGKLANLVLLSGPPFETRTRVERVWIRGVAVPLANHQTELRDKYKNF